MAEIQFFHFDVRARGEPVRLLLHAAGEKFDDVRIPRASFGPEAKAAAPYGQVPYMVYKGKKYGQSIPIATFIARKLGFYGKTYEDGLRVDEVVHLFEDLRSSFRAWMHAKEEDKKAESVQKMKTEAFPRYFGYFEAHLKENGSTGYFVGNSLSLADVVIYDGLDTAQGILPDAIDAYPCLQKLRKNVEAVPGIKTYLDSRPKSII